MNDTLPHGPHIHPKPWCAEEECLGHSWPFAIDRFASYGHKIFGDFPMIHPGGGPSHDPELLQFNLRELGKTMIL